MAWPDTFLKVLKDNDVRLITYLPDGALAPLLAGVASDKYFRSICATREDEAVGIVSGAWMGGMKSVVMMQSSGFALIVNALGSLTVPSQIPCIMVISERGLMGGLDAGQQLVARTVRPVLDTLGIAHHTLTDEANMSFVLDRSIKQAFMTQASVAFILSPLLTDINPARQHQSQIHQLKLS
jgi:sulfopyruvate decarboxylase TPP-binding subunit